MSSDYLDNMETFLGEFYLCKVGSHGFTEGLWYKVGFDKTMLNDFDEWVLPSARFYKK